MFDTYEHLQDNYIPNNINPCPPKKCNDEKLDPCMIKKPYEDYNIEGEVVGYWWYYKDILNLEFNITGDVVVEDNAIVYTAIGEKPTTETIGEIDQKAYNVVDLYNGTYSEDKSNVLTSIKTDVEILNAISKIITLMATSNQCLLQTTTLNRY